MSPNTKTKTGNVDWGDVDEQLRQAATFLVDSFLDLDSIESDEDNT